MVEDHVQGRYNEDLQYIEGKTKEEIDVKPKVWTYEEIYRREGLDIEETVTTEYPRRQGSTLPDAAGMTDHAKEAYIVNWISQERLDYSPQSDKSFPNHDQSMDYEHDRSDESCIVEVEQARKKHNFLNNSGFSEYNAANLSHQSTDRETRSSTFDTSKMNEAANKAELNRSSESVLSTDSRYKHISDHIKAKERMQGQRDNIKMTIEEMLLSRSNQKPTKTVPSTDSPLFVDAKVKNTTSIPILLENKTKSESQKKQGKDVRSKVVKDTEHRNRQSNISTSKEGKTNHGTSDVKTRMYKITQQEIVFYLKNKDGIIKVVRRPLLHSRASTNTSLNESRSSFIRHKSQPNLYGAHILRHVDDENVGDGAAHNESDHVPRSPDSHHLHMPSVGLLQHSLSLRQVILKIPLKALTNNKHVIANRALYELP